MTSLTGVIIGADSATVLHLFETAAASLQRRGIKVAGVFAEPPGPQSACGAGALRNIASGKRRDIRLEMPPAGTSCTLDSGKVAAAGSDLIAEIPASDIIVLSKFGKLEAMGEGLMGAFQAAMAAGKPVLTSVSEKHRAAWDRFAPDAVFLAADAQAIQAWADEALGMP